MNFGVDCDLDALKKKSAVLPETLPLIASVLSGSVGTPMDMRQRITVVHHHSHGYLLSVPVELKRFFRHPEFSCKFSGVDGAIYYSHHTLEEFTSNCADVDRRIVGMLFPPLDPYTKRR